jgi:NAD(P)-dependent dehydrogenase (short-subunit alcohol dehydrogenase family)
LAQPLALPFGQLRRRHGQQLPPPLLRGERPPAGRAALVALVPVGRPGRADEVSAVVLWLASDAAAYVTGQVIDANGGRGMR